MDKKRPWNVRGKAVRKLSMFAKWVDPKAITFKGKGKKKKKNVNEKLVKQSLEMRKLSTAALLEALAQWEQELPSLKAKNY